MTVWGLLRAGQNPKRHANAARGKAMWGKLPFYLGDNLAVEVRNLGAASAWYKEKLGLRDAPKGREDDSGRPFVDLQLDGTLLTLVEVEPGLSDPQGRKLDPRPVFFTKNVQKAYEWMRERGISVGPVSSDSGGNQLFEFRDLDGNSIEVCKEP